MRTIRVSDEVWNAIAGEGRFGETEDDVLRRKYGVSPADRILSQQVKGGRRGRGNVRYATKRMSTHVKNNRLVIEFEGGANKRWPLPAVSNRSDIKRVRDEAVAFAKAQGATDPGQTNAVRKALTNAGYHVYK